jgi:hypothetical protein
VNAALWVVQVLLSLFWLAAGWNHGLRPLSDTIQSSPWARDERAERHHHDLQGNDVGFTAHDVERDREAHDDGQPDRGK